jgi:hypothetical protein
LICKGTISTVDNVMKKARVILSELNNRISSELTIAHYVGEVKVNDVVVISFYNDDISEGLIVANLSSNLSTVQIGNNDTFTHTQLSSQSTWVVKHNLNKMPSVTIVDSADNVVIGEVEYIDSNNIIISFSGAFSGCAYIN